MKHISLISSLIIVVLICSTQVVQSVPNYQFACNLGQDNWLAIVDQPCSRNPQLTVPPNTRVIVTGRVHSSCGTYATVFVHDVQAGYVEERFLCKPRVAVIYGDDVIPCKLPGSWDFLNLFREPYTRQPPIGIIRRGEQALVIDGPSYNNQIYMIKVYVRSTGAQGWVDANYLCFASGTTKINPSKRYQIQFKKQSPVHQYVVEDKVEGPVVTK